MIDWAAFSLIHVQRIFVGVYNNNNNNNNNFISLRWQFLVYNIINKVKNNNNNLNIFFLKEEISELVLEKKKKNLTAI